MRRAIAAVVTSGLVIGGAVATPIVVSTFANHNSAATAGVKPTVAMKTVIYRGYEFKVPASWPVYRLDEHPSTCVRYDVNAVYLGTPGANMQCPASVVGRAQTVSVIPGTTRAAGSGSEVTYQRQQPDGVGGTVIRSLTAVRAAVTENAAQHELRVALGAATLGATVLGTYGADPAVVEQVLSTLRAAPRHASATRPTGPAGSWRALSSPARTLVSPQGAARVAAALAAREKATGLRKTASGTPVSRWARSRPGSSSSQSTDTGWHGVPPDWPIQIVAGGQQPPTTPKPPAHPVSAFDTCTAPSLATMRVWRSEYAAIGVYIGGVNSGCAYGNLSASWMRSAAGMGWGMIPTYVGPQAPCWGYSGTLINPSQAAAEGRAAGLDAVGDARLFGVRAGSPIYYDMEAYVGNASCTSAVLTFLGAWDSVVSRSGYVTGVYSSNDTGIADLQAAVLARTPGFTAPEAIWFALWDGDASLSDGSLEWPAADRLKQYEGNLWSTVGGITLNIDKDLVGGPLAR